MRTKDGLTIQGLLIKQGDPLMMRSMGGLTQIIPADRVAGAAADEGVADDERGAARPDRAGRRRHRRVPGAQLTGAHPSAAKGITARLTCLTYNIHSGIGVDGRYDLDRIRRVLADERPDVAGLQELDCGKDDQSSALAGGLALTSSFCAYGRRAGLVRDRPC